MVETYDHFVKRLGVLGRKHQQMTHGYTTKVGRDGLIVVRPKRRARNASGLRLVMIAVGMFFVLKIVMLASVGPVSYSERLAGLKDGTIVDQAGAFVMGVDPITQAGTDLVGPFLRPLLK
jgi:hypothetical protein